MTTRTTKTVDPIEKAMKELKATQVMVSWGGMWMRAPSVDVALGRLCGRQNGKPVLVVPCGDFGCFDDHGRIYPQLHHLPRGTPLTAFLGIQKRYKGRWSVVEAQPWN